MLCQKPFMVGGTIPAGCSTCPPCRSNRRRLWKSRILQESLLHGDNTFVTLTYSPENYPRAQSFLKTKRTVSEGSLIPRDVDLFLKKLRLKKKFRFFLAGEYGAVGGRPHYHLALFGFPTCTSGRTDMRLQVCCVPCKLVSDAWGLGGVQLGELNDKSANYIAKYITKGWTKNGSEMLRGRYPEYNRMSLRKGLGHGAMVRLGSVLKKEVPTRFVGPLEDVPMSLRQSMSNLPLGRYLRSVLRKELNVAVDGKTPQQFQRAYFLQMQKLRQEAARISRSSSEYQKIPWGKKFAKYIVDLNKQKWLNLEARLKIKSNKGVL